MGAGPVEVVVEGPLGVVLEVLVVVDGGGLGVVETEVVGVTTGTEDVFEVLGALGVLEQGRHCE